MKKKKIICMVMAAVCCIGVFSSCSISGKNIRFGAADIGGTYYTFANSFTETAGNEESNYTFEVKTTAGSMANVRLLSENYIQMAVCQADLANQAYLGTGVFEDNKKYQGYSAVACLYTEACQIVVRKDSDIDCLDDLEGKTVSIGAEESGTEQNAKQILSAAGLGGGIVKMVNLDYTQAAEKLKSGKIDAFFCTAGVGTTVVEELAKQCDIKLIGIEDKIIGRITEQNEYCEKYTVEAGTYKGVDEDINTIGVKALLLVNNKLSEKAVYYITKTLFENSDKIQYSVPVDFDMDIDNALEKIDIPIHQGALNYYEEQGKKIN